MSKVVYVSEIPLCDFCSTSGMNRKAKYDAKTQWGPWANMCEIHFRQNGIKLGTGFGQELKVGEKPKPEEKSEVLLAVEMGLMSYDEFEELVGDGDPEDYL